MSAYLAILSARFRTLLQYRAAAVAGMSTQLFWGLIRTMIFEAFYHSSAGPQPMSRAQVITYIWLGQAMLGLLPWGMDPDVRTMIRTGTVAYELVRPLDLYWLWFMRALAARTAPTLLRSVPLFVIAGLFFGLQSPPSLAAGLGWALSTVGAVLLSCAFGSIVTISMLWTVSGDGLDRFLPALVYPLSGMLIPLPLFPSWLQPTLKALPFRDMVDVPFRVYLGHIPPSGLGLVLLHQAVWILVLVFVGRAILARGVRHMVIQGG